ncbi:hypothetical protein GM3708_1517 [Geminocystis sp. NIES-3708]|nr:hypothetical protein [Geminocystis sp. NIES-3708]BAQ61111.1 hypothetical protein GM3708_1517 [Geminocystis sp. NIES-3708]
MENLKITLEQALEFNPQEAINSADGSYFEEKLQLSYKLYKKK